MAKILCVDDDAATLAILCDTLDFAGHQVTAASDVASALIQLRSNNIDLIISDYKMPGTTGLEFLQELKDRGIDTPLIMITGHASIEHAVAAIKAGAVEYLTKPFRSTQLTLCVDQALDVARLRRENAELRAEVTQLRTDRSIVGESAALKRIMATVHTVAPARASVLIEGESGTGKELIARALHELSDRREGPFVSINCAALPEQLIESTLFGHEKGAFTGAIKQVKGAFERAHRGTLLLDEISEMRLDLQAKLLRVLQEQEFERVGGTHAIKVDVRVVATTNRDLAAQARAGTFREDLFYRLSVVPLRLPPLRERIDDIALLAHHFARRAGKENGKRMNGLTPGAVAFLQEQAWQGNVRELMHTVERAVILEPGDMLTLASFDPALLGRTKSSPITPREGEAGVAESNFTSLNLADAEKLLIVQALEKANQNRTRAADLLGISVRTLRNKLNGPTAVV